jgi:hypothetical protein
MPTSGRLRAILSALSSPAAGAEIHGLDIPDPSTRGVETDTESGRAGNSPLGNEVQGYVYARIMQLSSSTD